MLDRDGPPRDESALCSPIMEAGSEGAPFYGPDMHIMRPLGGGAAPACRAVYHRSITALHELCSRVNRQSTWYDLLGEPGRGAVVRNERGSLVCQTCVCMHDVQTEAARRRVQSRPSFAFCLGLF